jgi:glycosyltransferase involved in cell wall biosynthesis
MSKKKVFVLVSNDLVHDQRVRKTCDTLIDMGFDVELVGRLLPSSEPLSRNYATRRLNLLFHSGVLFYVFLQIRFFCYTLWRRQELILANDLDTLLPAFLVGKLKGIPVVYDSHELFTEAEGLTGHPLKKKIWEWLESFLFPRVKYAYTVNESIASIFEKKYGVQVGVVRNVPQLLEPTPPLSKSEMGLAEHVFVFILQGNYLDPDRGGIEAVEAMALLDGAHLFVIGSGRDFLTIKEKARLIPSKVTVLDKMPYAQLMRYTAGADCGLSLDKPLHLNYTLSLPNKVFDYIHAEIPVVVSPLPELVKLVSKYEVGLIAEAVTPQALANAMREMMQSKRTAEWKANCRKARTELNWEIESSTIRNLVQTAIPTVSKPTL